MSDQGTGRLAGCEVVWGSSWRMCSGILQVLVLTSCVTLDKSPHLSELPSPLQNDVVDGVPRIPSPQQALPLFVLIVSSTCFFSLQLPVIFYSPSHTALHAVGPQDSRKSKGLWSPFFIHSININQTPLSASCWGSGDPIPALEGLTVQPERRPRAVTGETRQVAITAVKPKGCPSTSRVGPGLAQGCPKGDARLTLCPGGRVGGSQVRRRAMSQAGE